MIVIRELIVEHDVLLRKYSKLFLDYVLLEVDEKYLCESTHKEAIKTAFKILNKREQVGNRINMQFTFNEKNLVCYKCINEEFF